jgi:hypothetical protein
MTIISQSKVRRDDYVIWWNWDEIQRLLRDDAERQLREAGIDIPEGGVTFMNHIDKVKIVQLEEGSPSYKVEKFKAEMKIILPASDGPLLELGKR